MALPLGELSPKVTERALQALPISSGRCSNGTHLRLVIARSEATWQSRSTRYDNRKTIGESVTAFPRLPRPLRGLAMTRREACRIRRGTGTNSQAPPSRVIPRSEASLALPLGELSPKVTERALQALLNGNSNQGKCCFSLSGGCAASSPKGRAKLRNDKTGSLPHSPGRRDRPGNRINNPDSRHTLHSAQYIPCAARPFRP